jgi:hypothetical protein
LLINRSEVEALDAREVLLVCLHPSKRATALQDTSALTNSISGVSKMTANIQPGFASIRAQEKIRAFARAATVYELVEPVLRIASDGHVEHV